MTKTPNKGASADRMAAMRAARAAKKAATHEGPEVAGDVVAASAAVAEPIVGIEVPSAPTTMERVALSDEAKRAAKVAALRAAKVASANPVGEPAVTVRVTKKGDGKVSMGEHIKGLGDLTYDHNEEPSFPLSIAQELEERGFVEIQ